MKFLEKDLEDIIYNYPEECGKRGLPVKKQSSNYYLFRQVTIEGYGVADLISVEFKFYNSIKHINVTIIECKLNEINIQAYMQAKRYLTGIRQLLDLYNLNTTHVHYETVLVGTTIDTKSDFVFVLNDDTTCKCFTYDYMVDGIHFKDQGKGWKCSGHSFSKKYLESLTPSFREMYKRAYKYSIENPEETPF